MIAYLKEKALKYSANSNDLLFALLSFLFGFAMSLIVYCGDDPVMLSTTGDTLNDWIIVALNYYTTWSSRILVNFIIILILHLGRVAFGLFMAASMYVLLLALDRLFLSEKRKEMALAICCVVMLYPFSILNTAGWVATAATYFTPIAFGVMSFLPIKKAYDNEHISVGKFFFYALCLIYAANEEQMMAVILGVYVVASCFLIYKKKFNWKIAVLTCLAVFSAIFTLTCPGNYSRKTSEINQWFPTYPMLDTLDKLDIGVSSTLYWMFFESNFVMLALCVTLTFLIWIRYNNVFYRMFSVFPNICCVMLGVIPEITNKLFPYLGQLTTQIHTNGSFTVEMAGKGLGPVQFWIMLFLVFLLFIELFLLNDNIENFLVSFVLLGCGIASRVVIGFSPTVYASSTRTCSVLAITIIMVLIQVLNHNRKYLLSYFSHFKNKKQIKNSFMFITSVVLILSVCNLIVLTATFGR